MRIKLSAETLKSEWVRRVEEYSGQNLLACYQCGKCSAGCPVAFKMDLLPSQVIRLAQLGQAGELLNAEAPWYCASCQACYSRCPKGLDLPRIMEALREIILQQRGDHIAIDELPPDELAEFTQQVYISSFRKYTA
jgi:heterodisulfide reductase subunit C2